MARTDVTNSTGRLGMVSRSRFLHQAGLGVAGLAMGSALPGLLNSGTAHAAVSFSKGTLNAMYWYVPAVQERRLRSTFDGFGKQHGLTVKYKVQC